ncbi:hypothetical protein PVL29_006797 [Vitis rotundifolia]|uniref:Uncharacterized protein n=1 Tax=Vitis rotundifolia TaxID=103349 RepID=A0AA39A5V8_VITRO|nr:hypothetical protein PVL29_006791 [Vitis rotundifolia]KAJ9701574.1 hypothetical protein PVL29_006797 [Vitis rotundifolia]
MEKLNVVLIQEPVVLVGVEEEVQWIQRKLMRLGVIHGYDFIEELMDVAYNFEDERCILLVRIHKKQEMIKSKISHPPARIAVPYSLEIPEYLEEMELFPSG